MASTVVEFREWTPDKPDLANGGVLEARNVLPDTASFRPFPSLVAFSTALPSAALGAFLARSDAGDPYIYAGTNTELYALNADTWATAGSGFTNTVVWEFAKYGSRVFAVHGGATGNSAVMAITLGANAFSTAGGAPPAAAHIAVVREFLVTGGTYDATDGLRPQRVRWSAIDNPDSWTVDPTSQSDYQDLTGEGGRIQRVIGGEFGVVFLEHSIYRMTYSGSPIVFQFDEVLSSHLGPTGTPAGQSVVRVGDTIFYLGQSGFAALVNGSAIQHIGYGKVDQWFYREVDSAYLDKVRGFADPLSKRVYWTFAGPQNDNGRANRILVFDYASSKWSYAEVETDLLLVATTTGYTLDTLDTVSSSIDDLTESLDSALWTGDQSNSFGAIDSNHRLGFFSGDPYTAVVVTEEMQLVPGRRSMLQAVRPMADEATSQSVRVATRSKQKDSATWRGPFNVNTWGRATMRANARYHRIEWKSDDFDHAQGLEIEFEPEGER